MVTAFSDLRGKQNEHLKNFYVIIPPLILSYVDHMLVAKDRMGKKVPAPLFSPPPPCPAPRAHPVVSSEANTCAGWPGQVRLLHRRRLRDRHRLRACLRDRLGRSLADSLHSLADLNMHALPLACSTAGRRRDPHALQLTPTATHPGKGGGSIDLHVHSGRSAADTVLGAARCYRC